MPKQSDTNKMRKRMKREENIRRSKEQKRRESRYDQIFLPRRFQ